MKWIDLDKLKHEWQTFVLQISGLLLALHEAAVEAGADWSPFVPDKYRPYVWPIVMTLMLTLRKYKNK